MACVGGAHHPRTAAGETKQRANTCRRARCSPTSKRFAPSKRKPALRASLCRAGELKHGPLALVDEDMPVVAVAPDDDLLEKLKSNLHEVSARGGQLYVFADPRVQFGSRHGIHTTRMPALIEDFQAPILYTIPLQLLSYHVAVAKGTDVDQPRNLAKSVTVE